jgi:hypothetical protein
VNSCRDLINDGYTPNGGYAVNHEPLNLPQRRSVDNLSHLTFAMTRTVRRA